MDSSTASTHNPPQGETILKTIAIFAILYLFLVSIGMIGSAFKGMGKEFSAYSDISFFKLGDQGIPLEEDPD